MSKTKDVFKGAGVLLVVTTLFFVWLYDDATKPVVHRSHSTGEIVKVEIRGEEVPIESESFQGGRYHLIWVE